jgi:hypothetical protein
MLRRSPRFEPHIARHSIAGIKHNTVVGTYACTSSMSDILVSARDEDPLQHHRYACTILVRTYASR